MLSYLILYRVGFSLELVGRMYVIGILFVVYVMVLIGPILLFYTLIASIASATGLDELADVFSAGLLLNCFPVGLAKTKVYISNNSRFVTPLTTYSVMTIKYTLCTGRSLISLIE